jgi:hypothetical protein
MGESVIKLKYVDHRPEYYPEGQLKFYPGGLVLPADKPEGNIIRVTEIEARQLLKLKFNGRRPQFEIVKDAKEKTEEVK